MPDLKGGYDLVDSSNHSSRTAFPSWNHVSPRIGLSYQVRPNTVIRTGYGIFYLPVDVRWDDAPHNLFINSINTNWMSPRPMALPRRLRCPIHFRMESPRRLAAIQPLSTCRVPETRRR